MYMLLGSVIYLYGVRKHSRRSCTVGVQKYIYIVEFKKNLNASKPSEHPPQVEECLKV